MFSFVFELIFFIREAGESVIWLLYIIYGTGHLRIVTHENEQDEGNFNAVIKNIQ